MHAFSHRPRHCDLNKCFHLQTWQNNPATVHHLINENTILALQQEKRVNEMHCFLQLKYHMHIDSLWLDHVLVILCKQAVQAGKVL